MKRNSDGKMCNKQQEDNKDKNGPISEFYSRFFLARKKEKKS